MNPEGNKLRDPYHKDLQEFIKKYQDEDQLKKEREAD